MMRTMGNSNAGKTIGLESGIGDSGLWVQDLRLKKRVRDRSGYRPVAKACRRMSG